MMIILNFILAAVYLWMFIAVAFGDVVLSTLVQSLLVLALVLAFLKEGLSGIANKLK